MESRASGDLRTYRISKIPMCVDSGPVTHVITIGEDITEWKAALERSAQAEKLAAIGQLAAGVMHEINNPLATIAACAETMALGAEDGSGVDAAPAGYAEYLKIIDHEVHRCKRIIDGLLDFSRPKPAERGPVDLNAVVKQTLFLLKHHGRFKRTTVHAELDASVGASVTGDPDQLTQVLMALLLNAMDAMEGDGSITLRTVRDESQPGIVAVEVQDEGHGIPREELTKVFEPFYTTKAPGKGTGLGLSICYGIISDHGGRIEVDSTVGEGTTFRIVLPGSTAS
jgi:two-component system NtrC family sensor kinase